jgi:hypothetical protein
MSGANPAMKWASKHDNAAIRDTYLANNAAREGIAMAGDVFWIE